MNQVQEPTEQETPQSGKFFKVELIPVSNSSELPCPTCRLEKPRPHVKPD